MLSFIPLPHQSAPPVSLPRAMACRYPSLTLGSLLLQVNLRYPTHISTRHPNYMQEAHLTWLTSRTVYMS